MPEFVAGRLIDAYVYGEKHPYSVYTLPADIDARHRGDEFGRRVLSTGRCAMFISGYLPSGLKVISSLFGSPDSPPAGCDTTVTRYPATERIYGMQNDLTRCRAIRLAQAFPDKAPSRFLKSGGEQRLCGGFFGFEARRQYPGRQGRTSMAFTVTSRTIFSKAPGS